jgi:hypothetical protein
MGPYADNAPLYNDDQAMEATRAKFRGRWDIIEVFGGYLAVPDGTMIFQSTTLGGLAGKLDRADIREAAPEDHEIVPVADSAYSIEGRNMGKPANLRLRYDYPAEAICRGCHEVIRVDWDTETGKAGDWQHTGRRPGE